MEASPHFDAEPGMSGPARPDLRVVEAPPTPVPERRLELLDPPELGWQYVEISPDEPLV